MKILVLFISLIIFTGCGTFSVKNLDRSDGALEFAKQRFAKVDYSKLNEKINLPKSTIKFVGPVQLYSVLNAPFSSDQNEWNFVQRVKRTDNIECYGYLHIGLRTAIEFEIISSSPGKFYCFEIDGKLQGVDILSALVSEVEVKNEQKIIISTEDISKVFPIKRADGGWDISLQLNSQATKNFADHTKKLQGKKLDIIVDKKVISSPIVQASVTSGQIQIGAKYSKEEAIEIADQISNKLKEKK